MTDEQRQALEKLWQDLNDCAANVGKWGRDRLLGMYADKLRAILDKLQPPQDDQPIVIRSQPSAEYDVPVEIIGVERPPMRFHIENGNDPPPPPRVVQVEAVMNVVDDAAKQVHHLFHCPVCDKKIYRRGKGEIPNDD